MTKGRLEAFSDGVMAIIITIMVLELRAPEGPRWADVLHLVPALASYLMSFVLLGIYWSNHHHLFQATERVGGGVLWANLHLLFWLSLVPFVTGWVGKTGFATVPVASYGFIMLLSAVAYALLVRALLRRHEPGSNLHDAIGSDRKGKVSVALYATSIPAAWLHPALSCALFAAVAFLWLVPDRRIEGRCDP